MDISLCSITVRLNFCNQIHKVAKNRIVLYWEENFSYKKTYMITIKAIISNLYD